MSVFIDTAPFIYLVEDVPSRSDLVDAQIQKWIDADQDLVTSCVTLMELLVQPNRNRDRRLENQYRLYVERLLAFPPLPIDERIAEKAAEIRAIYGFKAPDALQLAAAISVGADVFYTNDKQLQQFDGLDVLLVDESVE
ncbi:MAG: hypothetical protein DRP64_00905 [Verrucomicrobia bacterium]|nr:MAG: hypothetical protein DRP64_00905 [Verrucomicrobiota bacterium]